MDATFSLPFTRASAETLERQRALVAQNPLVGRLIETVGDIVLILNTSRQVVAHNRNLFALGLEERDVVGLVPGEVFDCIHAEEAQGCGSTEFCKQCGAQRALATGHLGLTDTQECRVSRRNAALDLEVKTTPVNLGDERFIVVCLKDIGDQKRRQVLERIFFHDVLNAAGGIEGLVSVLETEPGTDQHAVATALAASSRSLVEEILAQRDLAIAENHELEVNPREVGCHDLVETLAVTGRALPVAREKHLVVSAPPRGLGLVTDPTLLARVLGNLVKNALEATAPGGTVTLGCEPRGAEVVFWVHNAGELAPEVRNQLFHRSFSTKGPGRGLGTYSVKLLTEGYLGGRVGVTTSPQGTVFEVRLPAS